MIDIHGGGAHIEALSKVCSRLSCVKHGCSSGSLGRGFSYHGGVWNSLFIACCKQPLTDRHSSLSQPRNRTTFPDVYYNP